MFNLAIYTVRESLRDSIYLGFLAAMTVLTIIFVVMGSTPWGLEHYVVERLGWMTVEILLCVQTAIYAVNNLYRERDKRIIYNHLTLPLGRVGYLAGKSLGLLIMVTLLAIVGASIVLLGDFWLTHLETWRWPVLWMIPSIVLKNAILLAYVLLFAQLASNALTASLFALAIYLVGNGAQEIIGLIGSLDGGQQNVLLAIYYVIPNLQIVDFQQAALYGDGVGLAQLGSAGVYAASYVLLGFTFACLLFRRKDL